MVFIDRSPDRPIRFLEWRVRLFGVGAILAVAGMAADIEWLIWVAIVILLVGFLLRFVPAPDRDERSGHDGTPTEPGGVEGDGEGLDIGTAGEDGRR